MTEPAAQASLAELLAAAEPAEPRRLDGLIARLRDADLVRGARRDDLPIGAAALGDVEIRGVTDDSRAVREGTLFAALPGFHVDGHEYVASAAAAGAAAAIVEHPVGGLDLPQLVVGASRAALARAAGWWYGDPSRTLGAIGITGTDGKTTTSFLAVAALEAAGLSSGLIGTVETKVGRLRDRHAAHVTTPGAPELQATLAAMARAGNAVAVIETTSHALELDRVAGRRLGRRRVHQPHPRAPRAPRHVRGVPRREAQAVPRARVGRGQPAQGRRRASVAQGRDRQPRRPRGVVVRSRRPRGRRHRRHLRHGPGRPRPRHVDRGGRPPPSRRLRRAVGGGTARASPGRSLQRPQRAGGRRARRGAGPRSRGGPRRARVGRGRAGPDGADRRGPAVRGDRRLRALAGLAAGRPRPPGAARGRGRWRAHRGVRVGRGAGHGQARGDGPDRRGALPPRGRDRRGSPRRGPERDRGRDRARGGGGRRPAWRRRAGDPGPAGGDRGGVRAGPSGRRGAAGGEGPRGLDPVRRRADPVGRGGGRARGARGDGPRGRAERARMPVHAAHRRGGDRGVRRRSGCRPSRPGRSPPGSRRPASSRTTRSSP